MQKKKKNKTIIAYALHVANKVQNFTINFAATLGWF